MSMCDLTSEEVRSAVQNERISPTGRRTTQKLLQANSTPIGNEESRRDSGYSNEDKKALEMLQTSTILRSGSQLPHDRCLAMFGQPAHLVFTIPASHSKFSFLIALHYL